MLWGWETTELNRSRATGGVKLSVLRLWAWAAQSLCDYFNYCSAVCRLRLRLNLFTNSSVYVSVLTSFSYKLLSDPSLVCLSLGDENYLVELRKSHSGLTKTGKQTQTVSSQSDTVASWELLQRCNGVTLLWERTVIMHRANKGNKCPAPCLAAEDELFLKLYCQLWQKPVYVFTHIMHLQDP